VATLHAGGLHGAHGAVAAATATGHAVFLVALAPATIAALAPPAAGAGAPPPLPAAELRGGIDRRRSAGARHPYYVSCVGS
jgi:hypothetical protein